MLSPCIENEIDLVYKSAIRLDDYVTDVEILDLSTSKHDGPFPADSQLTWSDGYVVVYDICDRPSFRITRLLVELIRKQSTQSPILLLGNKKDLDHRRSVGVDEGHALALKHACQYYEVSAAENYIGINIAYYALLRETKLVQLHRSSLLKRRKSSLSSMSKKLGAMFGKSKDLDGEKRKAIV